MSEEQNEKKCCKAKVFIILATILSLVFSIAALTLSIITFTGGVSQGEKKVVISTQYDKGKTLEKAQAKNKPIIVFFYTDWCGFCQRFAPTYDKISKKSEIKKNFAIAYVNCEKPENAKLMEEYNVHGYPTVYVIDEEGKRTQLENGTFFSDDSVKVVSQRALEIIGK